MKITVVCGNGLGTSLMMEMSIKSILKDLSVSADVDHVTWAPRKGRRVISMSAPKTLPSS